MRLLSLVGVNVEVCLSLLWGLNWVKILCRVVVWLLWRYGVFFYMFLRVGMLRLCKGLLRCWFEVGKMVFMLWSMLCGLLVRLVFE